MPFVRKASTINVSVRVPGDAHVHGSFTSSASLILRRWAHGLSVPATTTSGSSNRTC